MRLFSIFSRNKVQAALSPVVEQLEGRQFLSASAPTVTNTSDDTTYSTDKVVQVHVPADSNGESPSAIDYSLTYADSTTRTITQYFSDGPAWTSNDDHSVDATYSLPIDPGGSVQLTVQAEYSSALDVGATSSPQSLTRTQLLSAENLTIQGSASDTYQFGQDPIAAAWTAEPATDAQGVPQNISYKIEWLNDNTSISSKHLAQNDTSETRDNLIYVGHYTYRVTTVYDSPYRIQEYDNSTAVLSPIDLVKPSMPDIGFTQDPLWTTQKPSGTVSFTGDAYWHGGFIDWQSSPDNGTTWVPGNSVSTGTGTETDQHVENLTPGATYAWQAREGATSANGSVYYSGMSYRYGDGIDHTYAFGWTETQLSNSSDQSPLFINNTGSGHTDQSIYVYVDGQLANYQLTSYNSSLLFAPTNSYSSAFSATSGWISNSGKFSYEYTGDTGSSGEIVIDFSLNGYSSSGTLYWEN